MISSLRSENAALENDLASAKAKLYAVMKADKMKSDEDEEDEESVEDEEEDEAASSKRSTTYECFRWRRRVHRSCRNRRTM